MILEIKILNDSVRKYYQGYKKKFNFDSGLDLITPERTIIAPLVRAKT